MKNLLQGFVNYFSFEDVFIKYCQNSRVAPKIFSAEHFAMVTNVCCSLIAMKRQFRLCSVVFFRENRCKNIYFLDILSVYVLYLLD